MEAQPKTANKRIKCLTYEYLSQSRKGAEK
jgi:hypothetical protein